MNKEKHKRPRSPLTCENAKTGLVPMFPAMPSGSGSRRPIGPGEDPQTEGGGRSFNLSKKQNNTRVRHYAVALSRHNSHTARHAATIPLLLRPSSTDSGR